MTQQLTRTGEPVNRFPRSHQSFGIKNRSFPNDWWFLLRRTGRTAAGKAAGREHQTRTSASAARSMECLSGSHRLSRFGA